MLRLASTFLIPIAAVTAASPAAAQSRSPIVHGAAVASQSPYFDRATIAPRDNGLSMGQQVQARRWQRVGQCVVDRDRADSLSYLTARRGSDAASTAAIRISPLFDACLAGARIDVPGSRPLRRAAIADALGVPVPQR